MCFSWVLVSPRRLLGGRVSNLPQSLWGFYLKTSFMHMNYCLLKLQMLKDRFEENPKWFRMPLDFLPYSCIPVTLELQFTTFNYSIGFKSLAIIQKRKCHLTACREGFIFCSTTETHLTGLLPRSNERKMEEKPMFFTSLLKRHPHWSLGVHFKKTDVRKDWF